AANKDRVVREAERDADFATLLAESGLTAESLRTALEEIAQAATDEAAQAAAPVEGRAYIPRGEVVSLFQSALEEFYTAGGAPPPGIAAAGAAAGAPAGRIPVTDREIPEVVEGDGLRRLFEQFSESDAGWSATLVARTYRRFHGWRPFSDQPAEPLTIDNRA